MIFTDKEQRSNREYFIEKCRSDAWACTLKAEWAEEKLKPLYPKLEELAGSLSASRDRAELTAEGTDARAECEKETGELARQIHRLQQQIQLGEESVAEMRHNTEAQLQLAQYASGWRFPNNHGEE